MIQLTKLEFSLLCNILDIKILKNLDFDIMLFEDDISDGLESLKKKKIIENNQLTDLGEYITRTIVLYSQANEIVQLNQTLFAKYDERYCLIIEVDEMFTVFNHTKEELEAYILFTIDGIASLEDYSYSKEYLNLDNLKKIDFDNVTWFMNLLMKYDENNVVIENMLIYVDNGRLIKINLLNQIKETYGVNSVDQFLNKIFAQMGWATVN